MLAAMLMQHLTVVIQRGAYAARYVNARTAQVRVHVSDAHTNCQIGATIILATTRPPKTTREQDVEERQPQASERVRLVSNMSKKRLSQASERVLHKICR